MFFSTLLILAPLAVALTGKTGGYTLSTVQNKGVVEDLSKLPNARSPLPGKPVQSSSSSPYSVPPRPSPGADVTSPAGGDSHPSAAPMPVQVIDMLYAVQMPSYREEFEGKEVELTGQYVPMSTGNPKGDRFQAVRMFITCCAADAKPVGVTVRFPGSLHVREMGWLKIVGKPTFPMEGGRRTAVIEATKVEECPAPAEPFVY